MTNKQLLNTIKASFTLKDTSFNRFCLENAIDPSNAKRALNGKWKGEKATAIRELITNASGVVLSEGE